LSGQVTARSVAGILAAAAASHPEKVYVIAEDEQVTYRDLYSKVERLARGLLARGLRPGNHIALMMRNRPLFLELYGAASRAGLVFAPLVTESTVPEVVRAVRQYDIDMLIIDDSRRDYFETELGQSPEADELLRPRLLFESDLAEMLTEKTPVELPDVDEKAVAAFMITSGTTGRPKAIMHTNYVAWAQVDAVAERIGYTEDDRLMVVLPFFHGNALVWSALTAAYARASILVPSRFSASRYWSVAKEHGATHGNLLTGALNMLLAQPPSPLDRQHGMRVIHATVTPATHEALTQRFGVKVVCVWAFAESPLGTMTTPGYQYRPGLVGWPMGRNNEIAVMDESGRQVGPDEVGELAIKNDAAMLGYYGDPEATASVMRDGWVFSGDLGWKDSEGLYYFLGRRKQIIRRSGENISPEEVEDALNSHPAVAESAAFAVPDDIRGEEVKAIVVPVPGTTPSPEELIEWCERRLTGFKVPRYIEFRKSIPKTDTQKVQRDRLRAENDFAKNTWDRSAARR
jgi:crotonobetaine/carnitine-CoA ligase